MQATAVNFPWGQELEKTVVNSLATSFGLDFLLFNDKLGGDVDTVHNARQGIYASDDERRRYEERGAYKDEKGRYHAHENYVETGRRDKILQQEGQLHDPYRNRTMGLGEKRNLDHVISANEIHDDAGRVLAGLNGVELANQSSNLQTTQETVNKSKKQTPIEEYLRKLPGLIEAHEATLAKKRQRLAQMPKETPEQQHKMREMADEVRKTEAKLNELQAIDADEMRKRDQAARAPYNQVINHTYYTSSKFLKQTAMASGISGVKMGTRQMLGLVLAEVWFELRAQLPVIYQNLKSDFKFGEFLGNVKRTLQRIWERVQIRFQDFLLGFKDGVFAGVMASVSTTLFNVFVSTQKAGMKIIREVWGHLAKALKLLVCNPEKLPFAELCRAVVAVLSMGVATVVGSIAYTQLLPFCSFPFGGELAAFVGALVTGVATLGLTYFLLHSSLARKFWSFVEKLAPHAQTMQELHAANVELDCYLTELGRIEFNLDADELADFSRDLAASDDEAQRGLILKAEVVKRGVELPYEMGNSASTRKWLASLAM